MKAPARKEAVEEVRRFGRERDAIFDKAKASAGSSFAEELNADAVMQEGYLRMLFVRLGTRVVKAMSDEARKAGREHAERLLKTRNIDAKVR